MHLLRQINGEVVIETDETLKKSIKHENEIEEQLQQAEMTRLENERLRSELNTYKNEVTILRGERDSLMNTIAKLDIELTQAEQKRLAQQQIQSAKK
mgnify:FL=1